MANVRMSIDIAVPPERVWELVTDLERLGEWVSIHRNFPEPPPAEVREGTRVSAGRFSFASIPGIEVILMSALRERWQKFPGWSVPGS